MSFNEANDPKRMARRCIGAVIWGSIFICAGCAEERVSQQSSGANSSPASISSNTPALSSALNSAPSAQSPPAAQKSAQPSEDPSFTGVWEGSYNAKKGSVALPSNVKDKVRGGDDGKKAVGAGTVTLTISAENELVGKLDGALGKATLRGKIDGQMVRASIFPDDPTDSSAMTGVLVGMLKDGAIVGEIRVAGPDASVVRESPIELTKK